MNYASIKAKAEKAIKNAGKPVTLYKVTEGTFNGPSGSSSGDTEQDYPGYALEEAYDNALIDGTNVLRDDRKLTLVGTPAPVSGDRIEMSSADWTVISVKPFSPGPIVIYYEVQVRK